MDKKVILNIANIICRNDENDIGCCEDCGANKNGKCQSKYGFIAKALYKAGYRKQSDTAKDILEHLKSFRNLAVEEKKRGLFTEETLLEIEDIVAEIYGVEVKD